MDMKQVQLHDIQKYLINLPIKIINIIFNIDIAKYKFKYYSILEFFNPL